MLGRAKSAPGRLGQNRNSIASNAYPRSASEFALGLLKLTRMWRAGINYIVQRWYLAVPRWPPLHARASGTPR